MLVRGPNYGPNSRELVLKVYKNTETMLRGIASAMNTEGKWSAAKRQGQSTLY